MKYMEKIKIFFHKSLLILVLLNILEYMVQIQEELIFMIKNYLKI